MLVKLSNFLTTLRNSNTTVNKIYAIPVTFQSHAMYNGRKVFIKRQISDKK
jgi:hypothetical protein